MNQMQVEVRVFCGLEGCIPGAKFGEPIPVEIDGGSSGRELLDKLNIPHERVLVFLVNGIHRELDDILSDGDRVSIFPPVGGG